MINKQVQKMIIFHMKKNKKKKKAPKNQKNLELKVSHIQKEKKAAVTFQGKNIFLSKRKKMKKFLLKKKENYQILQCKIILIVLNIV